MLIWTSRDSVIWSRDADYLYYLHGPLAREEIGDNRVQGVDYAYTVQGWLKGVNSSTLNPGRDIGQDGYRPGHRRDSLWDMDDDSLEYWPRKDVGRDAFGFTIGYYNGDYQSIGKDTTQLFEARINGSTLNASSPGLYNGNIRHIVNANSVYGIIATSYQYDQLNRLVVADMNRGIDSINNKWTPGGAISDYHEAFSYDKMGNIQTLTRHGANSIHLDMDSMTYSYYANCNRLKSVSDAVAAGNYPTDIDNQADSNYQYDAIGELAYARQDSLMSLTWNVYGKLMSVVRTSGCSRPGLAYRYGPDMERVRKLVKKTTDISGWTYTYYVRDAQGNPMATYNKTIQSLGTTLSGGDCTKALDTFMAIVGDTNYKYFFDNNYSSQSFFITYLNTLVTGEPSFEDSLVRAYQPSFYAANDPAAYSAIVGHYSGSSLMALLLCCPGSSTDAINFLIATCPTNSLYISAVTANCTDYLDTLNVVDGSIILNLYNFFGLGPPTTVPAMITALCTVSPTTLIGQINTFNPVDNQSTFIKLNCGETYTAAAANYPGWPTVNTTLLETYYTPYTLVHCLETSDPTLAPWFYSIYTYSTMLSDIESFDPAGFVNYCLTYYLNWAQSVICGSGYDMNTFISMVQADPHFGSTVVSAFWSRWHGGYSGSYLETFSLQELDMYGSKRLGVVNVDTAIVKFGFDGHPAGDEVAIDHLYGPVHNLTYDTAYFMSFVGKKAYELDNHLGNVILTVSDHKIPVDSNSDGLTDYYVADVRSATGYYAFGGEQPGRTWAAATYRYAFNGQEKDDEISGEGNMMTAKNWEYDTRLGRRWNLDPLSKAWQSQYSTLSNSPIWRIDPNGDDDFFNSDGSFSHSTKTGTQIYITDAKGVTQSFHDFTAVSSNNSSSANIVLYYSGQVGINSSVVKTVGVRPNDDKNLGVSTPTNIGIGTKGGANPILNDYNNLKSTLDHEKDHVQAGDPTKVDYTFKDHLAIYTKQMDNGSLFDKTTNEYKIGTASNYASYLLGAYKANEIDGNQLDKGISDFNTKYKKYNLSISEEDHASAGIKLIVSGLNNKGKNVQATPKAQDDPH